MNKMECIDGAFCPNPSKYEVKLYRALKEKGWTSRIYFHKKLGNVVLELSDPMIRVMIKESADPEKTETIDGFMVVYLSQAQVQNELDLALNQLLKQLDQRKPQL